MIQKVPLLPERVPGGASIEFRTAEVPLEPGRRIPFALVRYSVRGEGQEKALRLDLDKGTFADHFEDPEQERILRNAGREIVEVIRDELRHDATT